MARTFDLVCHDCRASIWIGQRPTGNPEMYLYTTDQAIRNLRDFLMAHTGHRLEFNDSERVDVLAEYERPYED